ncbi:MAG TPA: hypothetical protein VJA23_00680 [Candidatus Nanoarchaeia archaeon]|nr:hypothetical protein [Candidatus Nanoarchaeia archaeon]
MKAALIIILLAIANLTLYWLFYGKKKFEEKMNINEIKSINLKPIRNKE